MKKVYLGLLVILLAVICLFFTPGRSESADAPDYRDGLKNLDSRSDCDALASVFSALPEMARCEYRANPINPSPIGPTGVFFAGYIYFADSVFDALIADVTWEEAELTPCWSAAEYHSERLLFSQAFSDLYRPRNSAGALYYIDGTHSLYFEVILGG